MFYNRCLQIFNGKYSCSNSPIKVTTKFQQPPSLFATERTSRKTRFTFGLEVPIWNTTQIFLLLHGFNSHYYSLYSLYLPTSQFLSATYPKLSTNGHNVEECKLLARTPRQFVTVLLTKFYLATR